MGLMRRIQTKALSVILCLFIILNIMIPTVIHAVTYSSRLGTNEALGSPLLNERFDYESWNKWELLAFGIFLSNFTNPLVDSYKTAFTVNEKGSAGAGRKALEFGSGTDSVGNRALSSMLDYVTKNQSSSSGKAIKAIYTKIDGAGSEEEAPRQATIMDLLPYTPGWEDNASKFMSIVGVAGGSPAMSLAGLALRGNRIAEGGPTVSGCSATEIDGYKVYTINKAYLCRLVVEGDSQGQSETVFDWQNGWDSQMMSAWIAKVANGSYAEKASENLKKMIEGNTPLFMDNFGNICGSLEGENIVLIPASANSHICSGTKYNLLNSVVLSEAYTDASADSMVKSVEAYKWSPDTYSGGQPLKTKGGLEAGDILVYFDSDYGLFEAVNKKRAEILNETLTSGNIRVNWGSEMVKLLNSDLGDNKGSNSYGIRMEVIAGENMAGFFKVFKGEDIRRMAEDIARTSNLLAHAYPVKSGNDILSVITTEKGDAPLFGSPAYVPVNSHTDDAGSNTMIRNLTNSACKYLDGSNPAVSGKISLPGAMGLRTELMRRGSFSEVADWLWFDDPVTPNNDGTVSGNNKIVSKLMKNSILGSGEETFTMPENALNILSETIKYSDLKLKGFELKNGGKTNIADTVNSEAVRRDAMERVLKVYPKNDTMQNAMNVLCVREGTEFALWTPRIYLTYLKWFGILDGRNQFNKHLFSESSDILNKKAEDLFSGVYLTKEEKEAEVLNYTYLMLHPTDGREYRADMIMDWFTDWIYKTYQNIVYGNSVDSYNNGVSTGTRSAGGFLHMEGYGENFITSWFMNEYGKYSIIIMGVLLMGIILVGILNRRTLSWFAVSVILMVNIVLLTPMLGEITPYVANEAVQGLFGNKMTYWSMAESVSNAKLEKEVSVGESGSSGLTVTDYIRMLNVVYLDRSIMIRSDISKKITEDSTGIINEIQSLNSARWLLPVMIRQFSANDGSADYVYQPLGDVYDNVSNMYWVYKPSDRLNVTTSNAGTVDTDTSYEGILTTDYKKSLYRGYRASYAGMDAVNPTNPDIPDYLRYPTNSVSRLKDDGEVPHAGFYLIPGITVPDAGGEWDALAENPEIDEEAFREKAIQMEQEAGTYDPGKGAEPNYGFLWMTENAMHYFYQVVKDSFDSGKSLAAFSGDLQGFYEYSDRMGKEVRSSFMHYRDTGLVRDFLDLKELFTNVLPYMYSVQLIAGGTEGDNGVTGDAKMTNYGLYEENNRAWLFQSNWVTKLMEDRDLTASAKISDGKGNTWKVTNPMLPSSYPVERPMIFSEAEMYENGMTEADLSIPELKILQVNSAVERNWTLLINYINTPDITTEVFYRQMAVNALLEFNREFSPDRLINGSKALYPVSLDLRNISFDSVMKMLMINSTRNAEYIYGDTMKQVIGESDIFSAVLMLLSAFFSAFLIPFLRNVVLGLIFYLGIWAVICNILAGGITKLKITAAYLLNNMVFLVITLLYYAVYALLINTSTSDSVLSLGNIVVNAGPPTWQFFIILGSSLVYVLISFKLLLFTIRNYRDLGFEVYAAHGNVLADRLLHGMESVRNTFFGGGPWEKAGDLNTAGRGVRDNSDRESYDKRNNLGFDDGKNSESKGNADENVVFHKGVNEGKSGYMAERLEDTFEGSNPYDKEVEIGREIGAKGVKKRRQDSGK